MPVAARPTRNVSRTLRRYERQQSERSMFRKFDEKVESGEASSTMEADKDIEHLPWFPAEYASSDENWERRRSICQRMNAFFADPTESRLGKIFFAFVLTLVFVSVLTMMLESLPSMKTYPSGCEVCAPLSGNDLKDNAKVAARAAAKDICVKNCMAKPLPILGKLEIFCVAVFTLDYLVRICIAAFVTRQFRPGRKEILTAEGLTFSHVFSRIVHFVTKPHNIIDLFSILPFYLSLIFSSASAQFLAVLRIVRLTRVFKIFRLQRYQDSLQLFTNVFSDSQLALWLLCIFMLFSMVIFGSLVYFAEEGVWDPETGRLNRQTADGFSEEPSPYISIPGAFWWVVVTMTTVGYGDVSPTTGFGYIVGFLAQMAGVLCLALPVTILSANFELEFAKYNFKKKKNLALQYHIGHMIERMLSPPTLKDAWRRWQQQIRLLRIEAGGDVKVIRELTQDVGEIAACIAELRETCRKALASAENLVRDSPPRLNTVFLQSQQQGQYAISS